MARLAQPFTSNEQLRIAAVARATIPAGSFIPAAGAASVAAVTAFVSSLPESVQQGYRAALAALDAECWVRYRRSLAALTEAELLVVLEAWQRGGLIRRQALRMLTAPIKLSHFDDPALYRQLGCVYEHEVPKTSDAPRAVRDRSHDAGELDEDMELECDVVVVGTGAGGAAMAAELAEAGLAVVMLEEGQFFDRRDFNGRAFDLQKKMYRLSGATVAVGNAIIPVPIGKTVGGTTTINSGTCYRLPGRVLAKWQKEYGLTSITESELNTVYDRVEEIIGVQEAKSTYIGGVGRVIARGCDALGFAHRPLRRNAPACDGKGICCFGCPTDAKRSTNVSYVPRALGFGAELFYGARVERILCVDGKAAGVQAVATKNGKPRRLTIRARATVISCGALLTPVLLMENGLAGSSGQLGHNLSIHPAVGALGLYSESIAAYNAIPQGYAIEEFHDEGLLYEGASAPLEMTMAVSPLVGPRLTALAESFERIAPFGFLVEDSSRGRVRSVRGQPLITYTVADRDVARLKRGVEILCRVYFAGGAERVYSPIHGFEEISSEHDLARLSRARVRASDFELSAYHPLGTARMGTSPMHSVVDNEHRVHDVPGLYVVDGASLPSSVGVNPQVTIMALATRAARRLADRLSG